MEINKITERILACAIRVHKELGPGLLESAYEECLFFEMINSGLKAEKQKPLPLVYRDVKLEIGYRVDILVEGQVVVEVKAVESFTDVHVAQVITYLKLSGCKIGLLLNFNVVLFKNGIKRLAN
jgi:GxxExxY protein